MLVDSVKYSSELKYLWQEVFGDDKEYINLLFDFDYKPTECFGVLTDGKIVSALYLLSCNITLDGKTFHGRYLYAAATLKEYRGKGLMGELIKEAQAYASDKKIDFISLVPANDGLYGYYKRFGFETSMYKYVCNTENDGCLCCDDPVISDASELKKMRDLFSQNRFYFEKDEMKYALSCLNKSGIYVYRNSDDSYYISDKEKSSIYEYISSEENFEKNTELLLNKLKKQTKLMSPYDFGKNLKSDKVRNGMIYPVNSQLARDWSYGDIYMNLALD